MNLSEAIMFINYKRVFNFAIVDFYRNKGISIAAIFILIVTILLFTGLFFVRGVSNFLVLTIQDKIDITAYFKKDTNEQDILDVKDKILKISPDIKNVEYVSKEEALEEFSEKHKDNSVFSKALTEVGDNPFLPSLNIITNGNPDLYEEIPKILEQEQFSGIIEKVDFLQKKDIIQKVFSTTSSINKFGLGLGIIFVLVAILVVFNTIKLVIDRSKEEIKTMMIVGASSWFIKAPFIIEGAIFGFISFVVCFFITILSSYLLSSSFALVMPGFNMLNYFISNFWTIVFMQLFSGVGLGVVFSGVAVKKYLKFNNK